MVISYIKKKAIAALLKKATNVSDKTLIKIIRFLEKLSTAKSRDSIVSVREMIERKAVGYQIIKRIMANVAPIYKEKMIENLIVQGLVMNYKKRNREFEKGGTVPTTVLISPTMRCNLKCVGCYAMKYAREDDLPFEVVDRIIKEGKKLGVGFFTFLGGEPFGRLAGPHHVNPVQFRLPPDRFFPTMPAERAVRNRPLEVLGHLVAIDHSA